MSDYIKLFAFVVAAVIVGTYAASILVWIFVLTWR